MKKALSICLLLLCLLPLPAQAAQHLSAPAPVQTHWVGEYQLFQQLHQLPPSALQARGLSPQAASALTGHSFEELLLERARLPAPVLAKYGYTPEQIALLRSYDGSSLQEQPRFFGAVARLQVEVRCGAASPSPSRPSFPGGGPRPRCFATKICWPAPIPPNPATAPPPGQRPGRPSAL